MSTQTDEDFYASTVEIQQDDNAENAGPTAEELAAQAFESGLAETLGSSEAEQPQEPVKAQIAGMSEEELKAALEKAKRVDELEERLTKMHDKAFGTIGNLQATINELKTRQPSIGKLQISKDMFAKSREYFDDDAFAEALAADLANVQFQGGGNSIDDSVIENIAAKVQAQTDLKLLNSFHPDWEKMITAGWQQAKDPVTGADVQVRVFTDEFNAWANTLKPEARESVYNSQDVVSVVNALNAFKNWRGKREAAEQEKKNRLEQAITPSGSGRAASSKSATDAFNEGLSEVVGQRLRR